MSDKLITLADQATTDELQRALFAALVESCDGVIDRYLDGTPAPQVTTRATGPLPAVYDDDTGKLLAPFDPLTLVIDRRCESFHGAVVHVELAPDVAAQAVVAVAVDDGGKPLPPETKDGKVEQPVVITKPDGKGGTVVVDGKTIDGVPHEKVVIDLSAAVPMKADALDTGAAAEALPMKARLGRVVAGKARNSVAIGAGVGAAASGALAVHGSHSATVALCGVVVAIVTGIAVMLMNRTR